MMSIVNDVLPRPAGMKSEVWKVVSTALAKKPEDRYRNAPEFAEALREHIPPATEAEIGALVTKQFPAQLEEYAKWEKLAQEWSSMNQHAVPHKPRDLEEEPPPG